MDQFSLQFPTGAPLSVIDLLIHLAIGLALSLVMRWHFERFGSTHSNREELGGVFPFIVLTTTLIITVVKSSLALSLGLVGALSIVRFRTPIKEPEELAYLFLAIAIGLSLGADQVIAASIGGLSILGAITVLRYVRRGREQTRLFLSVDFDEDADSAERIESLNGIIGRHVQDMDLRRVDAREGSLAATYFIDIDGSSRISSLIDDLNQAYPGIGLSFIDQTRMPSI
jgi:hypothetical protein